MGSGGCWEGEGSVCLPLPRLCARALTDKTLVTGQGRRGRHEARVGSDHVVGTSLTALALLEIPVRSYGIFQPPPCGRKETHLLPVERSFRKSCVVWDLPNLAGERFDSEWPADRGVRLSRRQGQAVQTRSTVSPQRSQSERLRTA